MKYLLDTCTFLWIVLAPDDLSERCRDAFIDPVNEILLSPVSAWEITVKHAAGKLELDISPEEFVPKYRVLHGIESLPLDESSALRLARLPAYHRDPFDRMLVCQALTTGATILTPDPEIRRYPVNVLS